MKIFLSLASVLAATMFSFSTAWANPSMLPKHPGYPMGKAVDPVKGQSLANDPGQHNAGGTKALTEAALADTEHVKQDLPMNRGDQRIIEKPGAGLLPKVQGPAVKIEPPVKWATAINAAPK
jgi:hypothetical protein